MTGETIFILSGLLLAIVLTNIRVEILNNRIKKLKRSLRFRRA